MSSARKNALRTRNAGDGFCRRRQRLGEAKQSRRPLRSLRATAATLTRRTEGEWPSSRRAAAGLRSSFASNSALTYRDAPETLGLSAFRAGPPPFWGSYATAERNLGTCRQTDALRLVPVYRNSRPRRSTPTDAQSTSRSGGDQPALPSTVDPAEAAQQHPAAHLYRRWPLQQSCHTKLRRSTYATLDRRLGDLTIAADRYTERLASLDRPATTLESSKRYST